MERDFRAHSSALLKHMGKSVVKVFLAHSEPLVSFFFSQNKLLSHHSKVAMALLWTFRLSNIDFDFNVSFWPKLKWKNDRIETFVKLNFPVVHFNLALLDWRNSYLACLQAEKLYPQLRVFHMIVVEILLFYLYPTINFFTIRPHHKIRNLSLFMVLEKNVERHCLLHNFKLFAIMLNLHLGQLEELLVFLSFLYFSQTVLFLYFFFLPLFASVDQFLQTGYKVFTSLSHRFLLFSFRTSDILSLVSQF